MNSSTHNEFDRNASAINAEETLRLIASLPAPEGIEDRVKSGLHAAPRQASVISWPLSSANGARWTQCLSDAGGRCGCDCVCRGGRGVGSVFAYPAGAAPTAVAAPQRIDGRGWSLSCRGQAHPQDAGGTGGGGASERQAENG